jgi:hypothetical protein
MSGDMHRSVPSSAEPEPFTKATSSAQHLLWGAGVSGSLFVRNVPQAVVSPVSGATHSAAADVVDMELEPAVAVLPAAAAAAADRPGMREARHHRQVTR